MILILKAAVCDFRRLSREEDGAAFIVTLGVFMFMFMLCCGVYAIGDTVREKIELQNVSDAAAYSAAVVQADTLSRIATISRAMSWTYVQMTRRQMDYIVDKWLSKTVKVWDDDYKMVKAWHNLSCFISPTTGTFKVPGIPAPGPGCDFKHNHQQSDTYWVGVNEGSHGIVHLNGLSTVFTNILPGLSAIQSIPVLKEMGFGRDVDIGEIKGRRSAFGNSVLTHTTLSYQSGNTVAVNPLYADIGTQILFDKLNINAMNIAEMDLVLQMPDRIKETVHDIIRANLPDDIQDDAYHYYLYQNERPYSYFRLLNNTHEDERIFLSFADYFDELHMALSGRLPDNLSKSNRSEKLRISNDSFSWGTLTSMDTNLVKKGIGSISSGVDRWFVRGNGSRRAKDADLGIQRCYKHWPEDILKSLHPSKYIPILPPSCLNFNGKDNSPSKLTSFRINNKQPLPSIGLYSEWRWYAMIWFCYSAPVIPWYPMNHVHTDICSMFWCPHTSLDVKIRNGKNCMIWPQKSPARCKSYRKWRWKHGRLKRETVHINTGGKTTTNCGLPIIGGYTRVYGDDESIYDEKHYVGAKCMPLLLAPSFFGKPGSLVVGISKRNENPFARILNFVSGIFTAFKPAISHMWAVSAARAGYRKINGGIGEYQLGWTDPETLSERWNLKQPDWDAVFLPVRDAWKMCAWNMFIPESESIFSLTLNPPSVLEDMMTSDYGSSQNWSRIAPPNGMHGSSSNLDWKKLSKQLVH